MQFLGHMEGSDAEAASNDEDDPGMPGLASSSSDAGVRDQPVPENSSSEEDESEQQSEKSWTSERQGPSRGSGTASSGAARKSGTNAPPPTYDGSKEPGVFEDYKIKAKLWLKTSNLDDSMKGARLLQGLSGRAFDQMKYLAEDETWLEAEDGGQQLIVLMNSDKHFGKLSNEDLAQELQKLLFDRMKDKEDDLASLRAKFDEQVRKLKKMKIEFPAQALGFLFLKKWSADLNGAAFDDLLQKVMTMANGSLELEDVSMAIRKLQFRMKGGTSGNTAAASTWLAEPPEDLESPFGDDAEYHLGEEQEILEAALQDLDDSAIAAVTEEEAITEEEAKEVLMSLIKSKYAENAPVQSMQYKQVQQAKTNLRNARGFAEKGQGKKGQGKKDIAYLKRITRCKGCNQVGHWHKDAICPKRGGKGGQANYYLELEDDELEDDDLEDDDSDDWTETLIEDQVADE